MKLQLTAKNVFAFFLFAMIMGEAHEISHFLVGKISCGCWPISRDFNAWSLCDCDRGYWATAAGPVFSMTLAWIGMFLLSNSSVQKQSLGFALIWANVPQARLLTVFMGGGDETVVIRNLTSATAYEPYFHWFAYAIVVVMALPPIIASFRAVRNNYGWLYNIGFMVLPLVVLGGYGFVFLNGLLEKGFLNEVWIMGTPLFITLHTVLMLVLLIVFFRKQLFLLVKDNERALVVN
jgi:hypothetical protein